MGYQVILLKKKNVNSAVRHPKNMKIYEGDNILLFKQYESLVSKKNNR